MAGLANKRMWKWAVGVLVLLGLGVAYAASSGAPKAGPTIVIDKVRAGERCVEDTSFMRKNHMTLLKHQRDDTMHKGIRTEKHSLKNCINCHASTKDDRVVGSDEHFCQSCHTYAAVKMDCWECHSTKAKPAQAAVADKLPAAAAVGGDKK